MTAQAAMLGLNDVFWLSAVILIVIIPLIWITKPSKGGAKAVGRGWSLSSAPLPAFNR
jgi:DHA2 family multidrug resistance protein